MTPGYRLAAILLASLATAAAPANAQDLAAKLTFCASCHGSNGAPHDGEVPIIWGQQAAYLAKQLRDYRAADRDSQIMSSIAESLTDDQITALADAFAAKPWPAPAAAPPTVLPATANACAACHGDHFLGGDRPGLGPIPRLAGQQASYLRETMQAYGNGERDNSQVMPPLMKSLKPEDRNAIAAALASLSNH